jgi:hypothetical protein
MCDGSVRLGALGLSPSTPSDGFPPMDISALFCERGWVGGRWIDPKRVGCHTGH